MNTKNVTHVTKTKFLKGEDIIYRQENFWIWIFIIGRGRTWIINTSLSGYYYLPPFDFSFTKKNSLKIYFCHKQKINLFPRGLENAHDAPFFKHVLPTFKISRASFPTTLCFVLHPKMNARIWSKRINGIIGERREANEPISPGSLLMDDQDKSDRNVSKNSINRGQKVNDWKKFLPVWVLQLWPNLRLCGYWVDWWDLLTAFGLEQRCCEVDWSADFPWLQRRGWLKFENNVKIYWRFYFLLCRQRHQRPPKARMA